MAAAAELQKFNVSWTKHALKNPYVPNSSEVSIYNISCQHQSSPDRAPNEWENIGYGVISSFKKIRKLPCVFYS